ncbi:hypothetical protein ACFRSX_30980 [Streptomyces goshikiensis]|uniref:hypothetical protein n=1 Tax=Streptomyces TaxID=1883 RepID=UPI00131D7A6E|nr:hypothetical protein [Streptomyces sp. CB02120-2]
MLFAIVLTAAGAAMSQYDYQKPTDLSGGSLPAAIGLGADELAVISHVTTTRTSKES